MTEQERINQLPEPVRTVAQKVYDKRPEDLPEEPERNKWYTYRPEGCICSNGAPYYSTLKVGTENKLMIVFCGGGVAVDAHGAARPNAFLPVEGEDTFYIGDTFVMGYVTGLLGIAKMREDNPFRNWSVLSVSYASGDFHTGIADFAYDDPEKGKGVCYHHGYTNYRAMVEKMKQLVPNPDKLLVTGYSGGGFAAALLTDDVMKLFPDCRDVTCLEDSGVFSYPGWRQTAQEQWRTPQEICDRLQGDNIALDCLLALHRDHGDCVKIAFGCTHRDALLAQCEGRYNGLGRLVFSKENGDKFQAMLSKTVAALKREIPDVALYIFDKPNPEARIAPEYGLTEHTFINSDYVFDYSYEGVKLLDWIVDVVEGRPHQVGLSLLGLENIETEQAF